MTAKQASLDSAWSNTVKSRQARRGNAPHEVAIMPVEYTDNRKCLIDGHMLSLDKKDDNYVVLLNNVRLYAGPDEDVAVGVYSGICAAMDPI
jgi:hypothetical protein